MLHKNIYNFLLYRSNKENQNYTWKNIINYICTLTNLRTNYQRIITNRLNSVLYARLSNLGTLGLLEMINESITSNPTGLKDFWGPHVHGENARRAYFIRALSNAYIKQDGEPHKDKVVNITNAIFEEIEPRYIDELTKEIREENYLYRDTIITFDGHKMSLMQNFNESK